MKKPFVSDLHVFYTGYRSIHAPFEAKLPEKAHG
jgi:hypothetical protein